MEDLSSGLANLQLSQKQRRQKNKHRGKKWIRAISALIFTAFIVIGSISIISWLSFQKAMDLEEAFNIHDRPITILLLGVDRTYDVDGHSMNGGQRADTLILLSVNPMSKKAYLISIPRDTKAEIPGYGTGKINSAHARGGTELAMRTVERLVGLPIDGYVETDFQGFVKLIDLAGGVTVNIDRDMKYEDRAGNLKIDLKAGVHRLDGDQALQFVRFRHDALGDIARIRRQQQLLRSVIAALVAPKNLTKAKPMIEAAMKCVKTDLSIREIGALGWFLAHIDENTQLETETLPGSFAPLYWLPDQSRIEELVQSIQECANGQQGIPSH
ncbi:MAG TPA: LCP family protein [Firmicutes bacterium]|nr:LCP family protein [Bacillota bacterium]